VRWKLNAITLVNNLELWTYTKQNFARIAEDIGALGLRVEKPAEIGPALQQALKADRPVVIDVVTDIDALAPVAVSE
jgi:acetolactate synthase I/II/III large subunit